MVNKSKVKNILLLLPYGSVGGMERLALTFYDYYKSLGYSVKTVKFIQLENDIINFGSDEFFLSTKDFVHMSSTERYKFYLHAPLSLRRLIKENNITHSIAFGDMANLFSSFTFTNEYKIGSIHALKSVELSSPSPFNKMTRLGYRSTYKNLDKLVCISHSIKEDIKANCGYRFSNLEVIYNPHDIKSIENKSLEPIDDPIEKELFSSRTILFLGRLSIQKAPWHLVQAFSELKNIEDINLVFIGDGDGGVQSYLKKQIKSLGITSRVKFLGRRSNPYKYLKAASCLALTSYYEGTPNVIVEALALNTPVVSSNCTNGILELMSLDLNKQYNNKDLLKVEGGIITPNFYTGSLVIPKELVSVSSDKEELFAQALETVLYSRENREIPIANRHDLLKKFDLPTIATQYLN